MTMQAVVAALEAARNSSLIITPISVQIGTLDTVINLTTTSIVLAETPDPVPTVAGFLLIDSEVMDITAVNGSTLTVTRAARGTLATAHVAGVEVLYLTVANGGVGRTFQTRTWVHGSTHENRVDLGRTLTSDDDDAEIYVEFEYDSGGARRIGEAVIDAQTLREMHDLDRIASSTTNETFPIVMQRADQNDLTNNAVMLVHVGRRRFTSFDAANYGVIEGNDGLIIGVGSGNASVATLYRVYMRVTLVHATGGAAAQSAGSGLLLAEQSLIANKVLLDEYDLDTEWSAVGANDTLYFAGIHQDSVDRVELGFNISSHYQRPVTITGRQLKEIGSHSFPTLPVAATTVDAIYVSGRTVGSFDSREPMLINPKYGFLEERRAADRFGILMFFSLNTSGNWISLQIYVSSDEEIDLDYAYIIPRGAAA